MFFLSLTGPSFPGVRLCRAMENDPMENLRGRNPTLRPSPPGTVSVARPLR